MTAADALRSHLLDPPSALDPCRLAALGDVRRFVGRRIYLVQIPQRERPRWPAITIRQISAARAAAQTGPVRLAAVRLQVDVWSRRALDDVAAAGEALRRALDGWPSPAERDLARSRGGWPTLAGQRVDRIGLEDEADEYDAASARRLWRRRQDWRIWIDDDPR